MSDENGEIWHVPAHTEPDDLWERLGRGEDLGESERWIAIDGILGDGVRVYFRREITEKGPAKITGLCIVGDELTSPMIRSVPMVRLENFDQAFIEGMNIDKLEVLSRDNYDDPEDFADSVAFNYRWFAANSSSPTKDFAEHSGIRLATARDWIREARLRGKLPPGRRGKAG